MALLFSSSAEVINRKCDSANQSTPKVLNLTEFYEISSCVEWISTNNFKKVALQFPDSLLKDAADVAVELKKLTLAEIYVLGDTSYGSCCVDEVAAEHVQANAIIHFGHACISPTNRLPVLYIFGKLPLDVEDVHQKFKNLFPDKEANVLVFCDVSYFNTLGKVKSSLDAEYKNLVFCEHSGQSQKEEGNDRNSFTEVIKCGRTLRIPKSKSLSSYCVFYIGLEQQTLTNLMLSYSQCKFFSYDPMTRLCRPETMDVNKYLRRRYYCIERIKDAKIIGILVGTLGVRNYLQIINHLRTLAKCSGKKAYTLAVGKLNVAKLANFPEIEVFVYVSCPESSVIDHRDFYRPIVTPFEMEIACNQARDWTEDYITDFSELLPGAAAHVPLNVENNEVADVSLVTGKFRSMGSKPEQEEKENPSVDVLLRDKMEVASIHVNAAGEHLAGRSWRGLEPRLGETPVSAATQGQHGIAAAYEGEGNEE